MGKRKKKKAKAKQKGTVEHPTVDRQPDQGRAGLVWAWGRERRRGKRAEEGAAVIAGFGVLLLRES